MAKIYLEFELEDLIGVDCLFKIKGKGLVEGTMIEIRRGNVKITKSGIAEWYTEEDIEVVDVLFRE